MKLCGSVTGWLARRGTQCCVLCACLAQVGGLGELLVLLGHEQDARVLQAAVSAWASEHQVSDVTDTSYHMAAC